MLQNAFRASVRYLKPRWVGLMKLGVCVVIKEPLEQTHSSPVLSLSTIMCTESQSANAVSNMGSFSSCCPEVIERTKKQTNCEHYRITNMMNLFLSHDHLSAGEVNQ